MKNPQPPVDLSGGDDEALVEAARRDPEAFGVLYQRYLPQIYRYLRARTGNADDAADLAQQVFLKALAALPGYRPCGRPVESTLGAGDLAVPGDPNAPHSWPRAPNGSPPARRASAN